MVPAEGDLLAVVGRWGRFHGEEWAVLWAALGGGAPWFWPVSRLFQLTASVVEAADSCRRSQLACFVDSKKAVANVVRPADLPQFTCAYCEGGREGGREGRKEGRSCLYGDDGKVTLQRQDSQIGRCAFDAGLDVSTGRCRRRDLGQGRPVKHNISPRGQKTSTSAGPGSTAGLLRIHVRVEVVVETPP